jgi:hypothetical protein
MGEDQQIAPYEDGKLNAALGEMRKISPEAEQEFRKALEVIGEDRIDLDFVCQQIKEDMVPRWLRGSQVQSPNPSKTAILSRFPETILKLSDAIELLEMLGYELSGGGNYYGYNSKSHGYTLSLKGVVIRGMLDFQLVEFANQKLTEVILDAGNHP